MFAQIALAVPLWVLYELSFLVVWVFADSNARVVERSDDKAMQAS
jgi:Sec-independent protein secretion pathway component TatC